MVEMKEAGVGRTRLIYHIPSRCLIGYQSEFLSATKGTGIMNRLFYKYDSYKGEVITRQQGVMVSNDVGDSTAYSLFGLQDRGTLFIGNGEKVYEGMIVGENSKDNDLVVNVVRAKQLTNIRSAGADEALTLIPPRKMSLEQAMSYIEDDELVEVTPKNIRLRKRFLKENERKRK
jgi:GTP-binding protein